MVLQYWFSPLLVVGLLACVAGCGDDSGSSSSDVDAGSAPDGALDATDAEFDSGAPVFDDSCVYAADGVCDEPSACAFGSDETDCAAVCAGDPPPEAWGACRLRSHGIPDVTAVPDDVAARSSGGSGGAWGRQLRSLRVPGPDASAGDIEERHWEVYVPHAVRPDVPAPVVFYTGGFGDEMYPNARYTELEALAELNGFIVVYAQQAYRDFGDRGYRHAWYTYLNAWPGDWPALPDIAFFTAILDVLEAEYAIDTGRVVLTGTSRGGAISILVTLLRPDRFTGFASHAGFASVNAFDTWLVQTYDGPRVPAVLIAGSFDTNVPPTESAQAADALRTLG